MISKSIHIINKIKAADNLFDSYYILLRKIINMILYRNNKGSNFLDKEWDNLIILDGCRYDFFKNLYLKRKVKGTLHKMLSIGTHTIEFLLKSFRKKKYDDIVYLTSTPYVDMYCKTKVHKIISVWKNGWDPQYFTVLPETMYYYAIESLINYPNKRLIIHFMQPHFPYIGYSRDDLKENFKENIKKKIQINNQIDFYNTNFKKSLFSIYAIRLFRLLKNDFQIKGYIKNLKLVLPFVEKLIEILPGTTVVTADHGEAFGDKIHTLLPIKFYGHDFNIRIPSLVNIPWLLIKSEEKDVKAKNELIKIKVERGKLNKAINKLLIKDKSQKRSKN